ncbi:uncharacterized protein [Rutidosis leptorrhynchoides]|uniref:uncharacterized protein n=1 Tax=Rutidosis leptorrhynchoides TaxID=125765 RepID=UPI003A9A4DDE
MVSTVRLVIDKNDTWSWNLCRSGIFSTKSLTKQVMVKCFPPSASNVATQRNNFAPIKVGVFLWRARRNRLPVLVELDKRGIDLHSVLCPLCDKVVETVNHALFSCDKVREVWVKVLNWWGIDSSQHDIDNMLSGNLPLQCSKVGENIWQAMVWISTYLI